MAGAALVTSDTVEPVRTQARLTVFSRKARFTEAGAAHMVAFPPIDTLAGLRTAHSVPSHRTLVLAPFPRVSWTAMTLACGGITGPSVMALTFL